MRENTIMREKRKYTISKIITYFEYDKEEELLTIAFNDGVVIDFSPFPEELYHEFEKSESYGKYYLKNIRGKFTQKIRFE